MLSKTIKSGITKINKVVVKNSSNEEVPVKKIIKYSNNISTEIYPNKVEKLIVKSSLDSLVNNKEVEDDAYGAFVVDEKQENHITSFTITVKPYPNNAYWKIGENVYQGENTVTCDITFDNQEQGTTVLNTVHVQSIDETIDIPVNYYTKKLEDKSNTTTDTTNPYLKWTFDESLTDTTGQYTFVKADSSLPVVYQEVNGKDALGSCPSTENSDTTQQNVYVLNGLPFDSKTEGGAISLWINQSSYNSASFGFIDGDAIDARTTSTNHVIALVNANGACGGRIGYKPSATYPSTTGSANRLSMNEWHHLLITWSKTVDGEDIMTIPGVTYDETGGAGKGAYVWSSVNFKDSSNKHPDFTISRQYNADTKNGYFLARYYCDGVLCGEDFSQISYNDVNGKENTNSAYTGTPAKSMDLGENGRFVINFGKNTVASTTMWISDMALYTRELSEAEVSSIYNGVSGDLTVVPPMQSEVARNRKVPEVIPTPQARLKPFIIDNETVVIAGDYREWMVNQLSVEYKDCISPYEHNYQNGYYADNPWRLNLMYQYSVQELYLNYFPGVRDMWDTPDLWTIKNNSNATVSYTAIDRWLYSNDMFAFWDVAVGKRWVTIPKVACPVFTSYIKLSTPMTIGNTYTFTLKNGESVSIEYTATSRAKSIKVNQEGYLLNEKKKAYFGAWLGPKGGKYPSEDLESLTFEIRNKSNNTVVYTGNGTRIEGNLTDKTYNKSTGFTYPVTGENTWELDFSDFKTEGEYYVYIPNVGCSWDFKVSDRAWDKALWVYARGMYHQRSQAKPESITKWSYDYDCHRRTYIADFFISNDKDYDSCVSNESQLLISNFSNSAHTNFECCAIEDTKEHLDSGIVNTNFVRELKGGWWDAADFDRRPYHFKCIQDLIYSHYINPTLIKDGDFDIPESGDTIPDNLSEAEYGLSFYKQLQDEDGGVGAWVETSSHESGVPWKSKMKYYKSNPNRSDTVRYAWLAAALARQLLLVGTTEAKEKSATWLASAIKAFDWASQESNTCVSSIMFEGVNYVYQETLSFNETQTYTTVSWKDGKSYLIPHKKQVSFCFGDFAAHAAIVLYAITKQDKYFKLFSEYYELLKYHLEYNAGSNAYSEFYIDELIQEDELKQEFEKEYQHHIGILKTHCENTYKHQYTHKYKMLTFSEDPAGQASMSQYIGNQSWGIVHPETKGKAYILYWKATGETKWKDAAIDAMNWAMGCNEQGTSVTVGVGKTYPVVHLDHYINNVGVYKNIQEAQWGISPYRYIGLNKIVYPYIYIISMTGNTEAKFNFKSNKTLKLTPNTSDYQIINSSNLTNWIAENVPLQRQYNEVQDSTVEQSEYTISETISGKIYMACALIPNGFVHDTTLKNYVPKSSKYELDGYISIP